MTNNDTLGTRAALFLAMVEYGGFRQVAKGVEERFVGGVVDEAAGFVRELLAEVIESHSAIYALRRGDCWCEMGIGNPMMKEHSQICLFLKTKRLLVRGFLDFRVRQDTITPTA